MRLGIMSDSHDHVDHVKKAVEIFQQQGVEAVLHGGDHISPFSLAPFKTLGCPVIGVFGNNDGEKVVLDNLYNRFGEVHTGPWHFKRRTYGILLMHEPFALDELMESGKFDLIVYGHTHRRDIRKNSSTLLVNPGECCGWLHGEPSVSIADMAAREVTEFRLS